MEQKPVFRIIESAANKKIKEIAALHKKVRREESGLFLVEGMRLAEAAVAAKKERDAGIRLALCTAEAAEKKRVAEILDELGNLRIPIFETSEAIYRKASATEHPQGILLVMEQLQNLRLEDVAGGNACLAVLDGIQDPGNAGTLLRTADAAGCTAVLALPGTVDLYNDKTVRASMGSVLHLPIVRDVAREDFAAFCEKQGIRLLAADVDEKAQPYFKADLRPPCALIFGNEGAGLSEIISKSARKIYIPMQGRAESLNVAVSSAVLLFEAMRQRIASDA